jgi:hypothetical protein
MTFQIGMLARDGIILASDMKATKEPLRRNGTRRSSLVEKIELFPDFCYCCSGDNLTEEIARDIASILAVRHKDGTTVKGLAPQIQTAIVAQCKKFDRGMDSINGEVLLGLRTAQKGFELWQILITPPTAGYPKRLLDKGTQGDYANSAHFFIERYYPKPISGTLVVQLLPLAAHCILMAGEMCDLYVDGLEIAICTESEVRKLTGEEIESLTRTARELDERIRSTLVRPTQS